MEITERLPLRPIVFLARKKYDDFRQECIDDHAVLSKTTKPKDKDMRSWYDQLQQFCKCNIKTKGLPSGFIHTLRKLLLD